MKPDPYTLMKAGLNEEEIDTISQCGNEEQQIKLLRKYRFKLLDEIHSKQQSLDEIDYIICNIKKHA